MILSDRAALAATPIPPEIDLVQVMRWASNRPVMPVIYGRGGTLNPVNDALGVPFGQIVAVNQNVNHLMFGGYNDGKAVSGSIAAGSNLFNAPGGNFQPADVGKMFKIAKAGASGHHLIGYIAAVNSTTQVVLDRNAVMSVTNLRCVYGTDDYAAILAARNYCWNNGLSTLEFLQGRVLTSQTLDLARSRFGTLFSNPDTAIEFMGNSGPCVRLNGHIASPNYGVYDCSFGGLFAPTIHGTSYSSAAIHIAGLHRSKVQAKARDANIGVLFNRDGRVGAQSEAAVGSEFSISIEEQDIGLFDQAPSVGLYCSFVYASRLHFNINKCGKGVYITQSNRNTFGGIVESNANGGVEETLGCEGNVYLPIHAEVNGTGPHFNMGGSFRVMIGAAGVGSSSLGADANVISGQYSTQIGGAFQGMHVLPSAYKTGFEAVLFVGAPGNYSQQGSMTVANLCGNV